MKFLVVLPFLAAAVMAAPAPGLIGAPVGFAAVHHPVHVQVPVTKTVHYDVRNVVTGYSTSIIKPAIAQPALLAHPGFIGAPGAVFANDAPVAVQVAPEVAVPAPADTEVIETAPAPAPAPVQEQPQDDDTEIVDARSADAAPVAAAPAPVAQQVQLVQQSFVGAPAPLAYQAALPAAYATYAAAPAQLARVQLQQDSPPFDQLVTKEKVLAPVRTHTQITPQVTQIQPEVTIRKVIHDVPVATPVVAQPIVHHQFLNAGPAVHAVHGVHGVHNVHGFNGVQFL